jgi:hypothetical protein
MTRAWRSAAWVTAFSVAMAAAPWSGGQARALQDVFFVNTTADMPFDSAHCGADALCPLRSAIVRADMSQGIVRACYDPSEGSGAACPAGAKPLRRDDPGYDAASGRWVFRLTPELGALEILTGSVTIDFTQDIPDWSGPAKDRIVLESASDEQRYGLFLESSHNAVAGLVIRGRYEIAALDVRLGASANQLGPGLVWTDIGPGDSLRVRDTDTTANRLIGSWCGLDGDGTEVRPVEGHCVHVTLGAKGTIIGGDLATDRNILAASSSGAGVAVDAANGSGTRETEIVGNWIGLTAAGDAAGAAVGIAISEEAGTTHVATNVIGGNHGDGILVQDHDFGTLIEDNAIGIGPLEDGRVGNAGYGIRLASGPKGTQILHNRIANNAGGILITGDLSLNNRVSENSITDNDGRALEVTQGANSGILRPQILQITESAVIGRACGGCTVEVFSDPMAEADTFEGRGNTDVASGVFVFDKRAADFRHANVTITGTDINGNTSSLSAAVAIPGRATATPSASPSPSPTSPFASRVFAPWLARLAER